MSDGSSMIRAPSRPLLRTRREYFWNTGAAFAQHSCYQVRSGAPFQPETPRSSTLRSSIVQCVLDCLRSGNEACTNCKRNKNSFTDRRSFGDRSFRNRQRSGNTVPVCWFWLANTASALTPGNREVARDAGCAASVVLGPTSLQPTNCSEAHLIVPLGKTSRSWTIR